MTTSAKLTSRTALTEFADGDLVHVVDISDTTSSAEGTSKKSTWSTAKTDIANTIISDRSGKTTPVVGDAFLLMDSEDSNNGKQITFANMLVTLNTIYAQLATTNAFQATQSVAVNILTSSANSVAIDASLSNIHVHDLTENTTLASPSNLVDGTTYNFIIRQHASSSYTVAYNSTFLFPDGIAPVMPTTNLGVMMISCIYTTVGGLCCVSSKDFS